MLMFLSVRMSVIIILALVGLFLVFHILVMAGVVPSTIVWGGRITTRSTLLFSETVSLTVLAAAGLIVILRGSSLLTNGVPQFGFFTWVFTALFAFNTVGNLMAKTSFERFAFTPVTLVLALLFLRLAIDKGGA